MLFQRLRHIAAGLLMLGAASASFAQLTIDFSSTRGSGVASNQVLIENVRAFVPVPNPFGGTTTQQADYNVIFQFDPASLHLVPVGITPIGGTSNCANLQVLVYNAVTGASAPVAGALVSVAGRTAPTNAQGVASFTALPAGPVAVAVAAANFNTTSQVAALGCTSTNGVGVALSPASGQTGGLTAGQFRVILTWGVNPGDLDSHMTGPNADTSRFHIFYADKSSGGLCKLDVDDTTSYGPETITCPATNTSGTLRPGIYRYGVHHYSGDSTIGNSGANVRLEFANGTVYTYTPPLTGWTGDNDFWTVFELTVFANGSIAVAPVNTVAHNISDTSVPMSAQGSQFGSPENPAILRNLPRK
ncbi:MAG: hypothetical protein V4864_18930 [Pseudomonadota bacterium]